MEQILFVGPVAEQGGPAIKNGILVKYLKTITTVKLSNTYSRSIAARVGAMIDILFAKQRYMIVSVSKKGRNWIYPFLLLKHRISHCHYVCIVIGGNVLNSFSNHWSRSALKGADIVTAETKGTIAGLQKKIGLHNTYWLPNYKNFSKQDDERVKPEHFDAQMMRMCFLSSMRDVKGVRTLYTAFCLARKKGWPIELDYYGPIRADFDRTLLHDIEMTEGVSYCGEVRNPDVLRVMRNYMVFAFPTEYPNEGFPAVLVEAQYVGLPVIASDINEIPEIVVDGKNGFIFPCGDVQSLTEIICYCAAHKEKLKEISRTNRSEALQYDAAFVLAQFSEKLRELGWPL